MRINSLSCGSPDAVVQRFKARNRTGANSIAPMFQSLQDRISPLAWYL